MAINLDKAIQWFKGMSGTTYSMTGARNGSDGTGDCSGMVVTALMKGGATKASWLYNTDSMHQYLLDNQFELISFNKEWKMQKGDVVILGIKGQSGGAAGHTFIAVDNVNAIDCAWYGSSTVNAVRIRPESVQPYGMGYYVYRLKNSNKTTSGTVNKPTPKPKPSKPNNNGWYLEKGTFKSDNGNYPIALMESFPNGKLIGYINPNQEVKYDAIKHQNGYVWARQPRGNGKYGYLAIGKGNGSVRTESWGKCY